MRTPQRMFSVAALLMSASLAMKQGPEYVLPAKGVQPSGFSTKITMLDGTVRMAQLEGLGCTRSICSRVLIKGGTVAGPMTSINIDQIAAIKTIDRSQALLVMKDGVEQSLSLINDFRVLYLGDSFLTQRLDLSAIRSIDFVSAGSATNPSMTTSR